MAKKSKLQRKLELMGVDPYARTRAVARDPKARKQYRRQMIASRIANVLAGGIVGGASGFGLGLKAKHTPTDDPVVAQLFSKYDPVNYATAIGAGVGAIGGLFKGKADYARRHTDAVNAAYKKLHQRRYKQQLKQAQQNFKEGLIEAIIDAVTPGIRKVAKDAERKLQITNDLTRNISYKHVDKTDASGTPGRIPGGRLAGVYGSEYGLKHPVKIKFAKSIGADNPQLAGSGASVGGVARRRKDGPAELHLSKEFGNSLRAMSSSMGAHPTDTARAQKAVAAHELVHTQDPHLNKNIRKQVRQAKPFKKGVEKGDLRSTMVVGAAYLSNPSEVKAYGSTLGHYGAREHKKAGHSRREAMTNIKGRIQPGLFGFHGFPDHTPNTPLAASNAPVKMAYSALGNKETINMLPSSMRRRAAKTYKQFHKAMYQGVEQAYPLNPKKFKSSGMKRPVVRPKLPEEWAFRGSVIEAILETVSRRSAHEVMMQRWGPKHLRHAKAQNPHELLQHMRASRDAQDKMVRALVNKANQGNKAAKNVLKSNLARAAKREGPSMDPSWRGVRKPAYKAEFSKQRRERSQELENAFSGLWRDTQERNKLQDMASLGARGIDFGSPVIRKLDVKN